MGSVPSLRKHQLLVYSESQDLLLIAQQQWKLEARNRCFSGPKYCRWLKTVLLSQPTPYRNSARAVALLELLQVFEIETFQSDSMACCTIVSSRSSCCLPFCWDYPNSKRNPRTCFLYCRRNAIAQGWQNPRVCATGIMVYHMRASEGWTQVVVLWEFTFPGGSISCFSFSPMIILQSSIKALDGKKMDTKVNGNIGINFSNN